MTSITREHSSLPPIKSKRSLVSPNTHTVSFSVSDTKSDYKKKRKDEDKTKQIAVIRLSDSGIYQIDPPTTIQYT